MDGVCIEGISLDSLKMKKTLVSLFFLLVVVNHLLAQISIDTKYSVEHLVRNVMFNGGQYISNIKYTGRPLSIGYFKGGKGIECPADGVILSTGSVLDAKFGCDGPQQDGVPYPGDPDLDRILGVEMTMDAASLEFDFVPKTNVAHFEFVFASNEYPEFVGTMNDVFAFFLTGENPQGGRYEKENLALLPGTDVLVSINTVNDTLNRDFYISNTAASDVPFDGQTVIIRVNKKVVPGSSYHLKLVLADYGDEVYDSVVLFKGGSFADNEKILANKVCLGGLSQFSTKLMGVQTWLWDFGDGQTSNLAVPTHIYSSAGVFPVSLSVTYKDNTIQVLKKDVVVLSKPEGQIVINTK